MLDQREKALRPQVMLFEHEEHGVRMDWMMYGATPKRSAFGTFRMMR